MARIKWSEFDNINNLNERSYLVGLEVDGENQTNKKIRAPSSFSSIIDVDKFNRNEDNDTLFNATTILAAATSVSATDCALFLKSGEWTIDHSLDLSGLQATLIFDVDAVLVQDGSNTFTFPANFSMYNKQHIVGDVNFAVFTSANNNVEIRPEWFGANPKDPDSDDTAGLIAFEKAVYDSNASVMFLPPGSYNFDGGTSGNEVGWEIRTPLIGYGAKIFQTSSIRSINSGTMTVFVNGSSLRSEMTEFFIKGIEIDSNYTRTGLAVVNFDETRSFSVEDVVTKYSNSRGVFAVNISGRGTFTRCKALYVKYNKADGDPAMVGGQADGFLFAGSSNISCIDCYAYDFRRIGFVGESNGGTKSYNLKYVNCTAEYANNENDSTNQINGGFWSENTNGTDCVNCTAINIASGIGQSRTSRGFCAGSGTTEKCTFNYINCNVIDNDSELYSGFNVGGNDGYGSINLENCYVEKTFQGVTSLGGIASLTINNLRTDQINQLTSAENGCSILINASSLPYLLIDSLVMGNNFTSANTGDITFFSSISDCNYVLRNCYGIAHAMPSSSGDVKTCSVSNCSINFGNTSKNTFTATSRIDIENSTLTERTGGNATIFAAASTNTIRASNSVITFTSGSYAQFGNNGITGNVAFTNCDVFYGAFSPIYTAGYLTFRGCKFFNFESTHGAIWTCFNSATDLTLVVENCSFKTDDTSCVPIKKRTNGPNIAILRNNSYNTTSLTDLTVTESFNNVDLTTPANTVSTLPGKLLIGMTTNPFISAYGEYVYSASGILLTDSIANSTSKFGSLAVGHYTNSEEPVAVISVSAAASESILNIGGGRSDVNWITTGNIYAAANNTTTSGSSVASWTSAAWTFNSTVTIAGLAGSGTRLTTSTSTGLQGNATTIAGAYTWTSAAVFNSTLKVDTNVAIGGSINTGIALSVINTTLAGSDITGLYVRPNAPNTVTGTLQVIGARVLLANSGTNITTAYGLQIEAPSLNGGTIGTLYGIKVENQGATQNALVTGTGLVSFGDRLVTSASTTTRAGLNIPHGTAPSSPVDGDVWTTTAGIYVRINGSTVGPLS